MARGVSPWRGRLLCLGAGALPVFAFPEPALWWFAWVCLVPAVLLLVSAPTSREGATRGWMVGTGFVVVLHHWVTPNAGPFVLPLGLFLGALWIPWGFAVHRAWTRASGLAGLAVTTAVAAAGWSLIEVIRSWESLGAPWGLLGATQWNQPATLSSAALGGVWLVGVLIVAANAAIAWALRGALTPRARALALAVGATAVLAGPAWSWAAPELDSAEHLRVALVQPGTATRRLARFDWQEAATRAIERPVDLVVWGESSVSFDLDTRPDLRDRLQLLAGEVGAPVLVNVDARRGGAGGIFKSSVLMTPDGVAGTYDKMRLVPFGEYVPLRGLFGWTTLVTEAADEDRRRGDGLALLPVGDVRIGALVCFESAFPDMSRNLARRGADVVIVQSATTSFQQSWAPEQHASLAAVRAVETGRPVIHSTLTGVTAAFGSDGRRLLWLGTSFRGTHILDVPLDARDTPFVRVGNWVAVVALVVVVGYVLTAWRRGRRGSVRTAPADAERERDDEFS